MVRVFTAAIFLSCFVISASAQTPSPQGAATQTGAPAAKPAAKKSAPKTKTGAKPAADSGPCQIGVIPVIGDAFVVQKVGFTVFGNELTEVPTNGWGLDDLVVARIRAAAPGATVRKITAAKDVFVAIERSGELSALFRDTNAELIAAIRQSVAGAHCKRYVLVQRSGIQFSNTNQFVRGVGIVSWAGRTHLFALTFIRVFDGEDFSVIKRGAASTDDETFMSRALMLSPVRGPSRKLEEGSFPATPGEAAGNPALRDGVRALLAASLDHSMPAMLTEQR
jgi:hypothetical protein